MIFSLLNEKSYYLLLFLHSIFISIYWKICGLSRFWYYNCLFERWVPKEACLCSFKNYGLYYQDKANFNILFVGQNKGYPSWSLIRKSSVHIFYQNIFDIQILVRLFVNSTCIIFIKWKIVVNICFNLHINYLEENISIDFILLR